MSLCQRSPERGEGDHGLPSPRAAAGARFDPKGILRPLRRRRRLLSKSVLLLALCCALACGAGLLFPDGFPWPLTVAGPVAPAPAAACAGDAAFERGVMAVLEGDPVRLARLVRRGAELEAEEGLRASWQRQAKGPARLDAPGTPLRQADASALPLTVFTSFDCRYCRLARRTLASRCDLAPAVRFLPAGGWADMAARLFLRLAGDNPAMAGSLHEELMDLGAKDKKDPAGLAALAARHGLGADAFAALAGDAGLTARLRADAAAARSLGVKGTPGFVLGGRVVITGLVDPALFEEAVAMAREAHAREGLPAATRSPADAPATAEAAVAGGRDGHDAQ